MMITDKEPVDKIERYTGLDATTLTLNFLQNGNTIMFDCLQTPNLRKLRVLNTSL